MTDKEEFNSTEQPHSDQLKPMIALPQCDFKKYQEHVKDFDLSEEEQTELLKTLWSIMTAFVDLGFGVDSINFLPDEVQKSAEQRALSPDRKKGNKPDGVNV